MIKFSMLRARPLTLFIVSAVLVVGGCLAVSPYEKTPKCGPPGTLAVEKCLYNLTVTHVDPRTGLIRGKVPEKALEENAKHSSRTKFFGIVGYNIQKKDYPHFEYTFQVESSEGLNVGETYEFQSVPGTSSLKKQGPPKYPDAKIGETKLYARHNPPCCMCGICEEGCVCPGEGNCTWCGTADVKTLLAKVSIHKDTVDIRIARGSRKSRDTDAGVAERFLALLSGSHSNGNISVKLFANYKYDQKFVPSCLTRSV